MYIFLLTLLVTIGGGVFFLTDINSDRPQIEDYFENQLGLQARFGYAALDLKGTPGILVKDLIFRDNATKTLLLKTKNASLKIDPWESLSSLRWAPTSLELASPQIFIRREGLGSATNYLLALLTNASKTSLGWGRTLSQFRIDHGSFEYQDELLGLPVELNIPDISANMRATETNEVDMNVLGKMKIGELAMILWFHSLYDAKKEQLDFYIKLKDQEDYLIYDIIGALSSIRKARSLKASLHLPGIRIKEIFPDMADSYFDGVVTAQVEIESDGISEGFNLQKTSIKGAVDLRDGFLSDFNIVRTALTALGINLISVDLKPELKQFPFNRNLHFDSMRFNFETHGTKIILKNLIFKGLYYFISGTGSIDLNGPRFDLDLKLIMLDPLADSLTAGYRTMRPFKNGDGRVVIPLVFAGKDRDNFDVTINRPQFSKYESELRFR